MQIDVVRHGKPAYRYPRRARRVTAAEFNAALDAYDRAGLDAEWNRPRAENLAASVVFSSDLPRALDTALLSTGMAERSLRISAEFREVPLPRFRPGRLRLPLFVWMAASRISWYFGWIKGSETRSQSRERVRRAADMIEEATVEAPTVLLFAHGFFLWLLGGELRRRGWRTDEKGIYHYLERRTFRRERTPRVF